MTTTTLTRIYSFGDIAGVVDSVLASGSSEVATAGITAIEEFLSVQGEAPLAQFQALRHHLVDAWALAEQAHSMAGHAAGACRLTGKERDAALSAAKLFLGWARQTIGRYAIQFHGAMGTTDEAPVSHFFKRAAVLETRFGGIDHWLTCFFRSVGGKFRTPILRSAKRHTDFRSVRFGCRFQHRSLFRKGDSHFR